MDEKIVQGLRGEVAAGLEVGQDAGEGDLLLEGNCRVEIVSAPETLACCRGRRYVFCAWNGVLQGRFVAQTNVRGWRVRMDESRHEAALVYVRDGFEFLLR